MSPQEISHPIPEQETWFRLLFERSEDAILLFDPVTLSFVDCNDAAVAMMKVKSRDELLTMGPPQFAPEFQPDGTSSADRTKIETERALARGTHRFEWASRRPNGEVFPVEVSLTVIRHGDHPLLAAVCRDITQLKKDREALQQREEQFRTMFERSADAMTLFDPATGVFVASNRASDLALSGNAVGRIEGKSPTTIAPEFQPDGRRTEDVTREVVERVLKDGSHRYEWALRRLDGTETLLELVTTAVHVGGRTLLHSVARNIDERKRMEADIRHLNANLEERIAERTAELRKSEERFRRVFEGSRLGICVVRWDGQYVEANPAYCEMLGYTREELMQKSLYQITAPDCLEKDRVALENLRAAGFISQYEKQYIRKDGDRIAVVLNGLVVKPADGEEEVWAFTEEVTKRKKAEQALRKSEEKFKQLYERAPLGISQISWDGRFLQVNEAFARIVGRTREEILKLTYWDFTPREYEAQELAVLEAIKRDGHFGPFNKEYIHVDGHRVPVVLHAVLIRAPDGDEQLWGIVEDVTERNQAEQALRESEQSYRALFETSSQGVMINDEKAFLQVNAAAAQILGYRMEDFLGKHPSEVAPPTQPDGELSRDAAAQHINDCMREGKTRFEWFARRADGTDVPLDVVLTRIEMGGRKVMQAMVTDISERKRAEAELKRALEHERELSQLKSNFVSMVSHEFRTPLGIIQSSAEILDDYLDQLEPVERREQLHSIIKNSRRMAGLMEEVLVLGRLDAGRMHFQPAPLDLAALCRRLVDEVLSTTDAQCPIEFFTAGLPDETEADERLLRHILINLLTNAVKYSEPGESVAFHAHSENGSIEFTVKDRGIGIPQEEQKCLFEAFHRGSNVGQRPGTGLGLVIVKRCVDLHGGEITIESRAGRGTSVKVSLPSSVERDLS